jgi:hypothetical protein
MVDLTALVKQASKKGDAALKKNQMELIQQQFDCLKRYLPIATCNDIRLHIMQQDVAKAAKVANKNFAAKPDKTDNLEVANMTVSVDGVDTNTHGMGMFGAETMGIF